MKKILWSFLGAFLFLGMPLWAGAQEEEIPPIVEGDIADMINKDEYDSSNNNLVVVAQVELYDAEILSQENNKFKLAFRLVNEGDIQPQIKYAVALTDENDFLIHQQNYDEMVTLGAGQELKKEIEYEAPLGINGKYKLNITVANLKGLSLALGGFGEVDIEGGGLILFDECYIQIGEDKFSINEGVDIEAEEERPVLKCQVFNDNSEDINAKVSVQIRERSMFGNEIKREELDMQVFKAKEKSSLVYNLFLPERPQAYDGELVLRSEEGIVSSSVPLHYVIRGDSATIQNISLDKDDYVSGDNIKINLMIAGDADDFPGAREWNGENQDHELFADVVVYNGDNQKCAPEKTFEVDELKPINVLDLKTETNCRNPIISLKLRNSEGKILDEGNFNFKTEDEEPASAGAIKDLVDNNLVRLFLALGFVLVIATIITVLIKNKKSSIKLLVIFVLFGAFLFFRGESVEAATYTGTGVNAGYTETYVVTYSLNTTRINQGGSVTAYSQVKWYGCLNANRYTVSSFKVNSGGWSSYAANVNGVNHTWAWSVFPTRSITYSGIYSVGINSVYFRVTGRRFFGANFDGQKDSTGRYVCLRCDQNLSYQAITPNAYSCACYDHIFTSPNLKINFEVVRTINGACNYTRAKTYSFLETNWAGISWCNSFPGGITNQPASFLGYGGSATWYCLGSGGGANATCTASRTHLVAECGTRATTYPASATNFPALTATSWCSRGTAEGTGSITFPAAGTSTPYWICRGSNSGSTGDDKINVCRASRASIPLAECGPAAKKYTISETDFSGSLCIDGTATPAPSFPGYGESASWICKAPLGGIDSPSCSASRSYDYPDVSFSIDPVSSPASPLQVVYDKNESSGFTSANVQLISKIDNFANACGTKGCYCKIDRNLGLFTDFSLKLPDSSQSSTDVISCGDFSYKLTCLNADGLKDTLTGRSEATVSASVVSKVEDIQTDCTDICGEQKYSKGNTTDHCTHNYTDQISCGLPNCPPVSQPVEVR